VLHLLMRIRDEPPPGGLLSSKLRGKGLRISRLDAIPVSDPGKKALAPALLAI